MCLSVLISCLPAIGRVRGLKKNKRCYTINVLITANCLEVELFNAKV